MQSFFRYISSKNLFSPHPSPSPSPSPSPIPKEYSPVSVAEQNDMLPQDYQVLKKHIYSLYNAQLEIVTREIWCVDTDNDETSTILSGLYDFFVVQKENENEIRIKKISENNKLDSSSQTEEHTIYSGKIEFDDYGSIVTWTSEQFEAIGLPEDTFKPSREYVTGIWF